MNGGVIQNKQFSKTGRKLKVRNPKYRPTGMKYCRFDKSRRARIVNFSIGLAIGLMVIGMTVFPLLEGLR
jgi:hypothetical protein